MIKITDFGAGSDSTEYHPYDPKLPEIFEGIKTIINNAIPDIAVEHIGSSSIPGLGGRNVLDIAIPAIPSIHEPISAKLKQLGFKDSPFQHYLPLLVAAASLGEQKYPVLLYVISSENDVYKNWITFRDYMRTHPEDVAEYDEIKRQAISAGHNQGDSYQDAKTPFLQKINTKIKSSGGAESS